MKKTKAQLLKEEKVRNRIKKQAIALAKKYKNRKGKYSDYFTAEQINEV